MQEKETLIAVFILVCFAAAIIIGSLDKQAQINQLNEKINTLTKDTNTAFQNYATDVNQLYANQIELENQIIVSKTRS